MRPISTSISKARLRGRGMKTVHFVCPSIWAWRADRIEKIRSAADHVLCIFPFEPALLEEQGVAASYVGHPLANVIPMEPDRAAARAALGLAPTTPRGGPAAGQPALGGALAGRRGSSRRRR